jgi:hypothetical protein
MHSALSCEHASKIEAQLKAEVADLLGKAEAADQADVPDGMSIPEELARREKRLAEIARAKVVIEARAKERHARERAEYDAKMAAREAKAAETGKKPRGREPQPPVEGPLPTDQMNLTDEGRRIRRPDHASGRRGVRAVLQRPGGGGSGQLAGGGDRCGAGAERHAAA